MKMTSNMNKTTSRPLPIVSMPTLAELALNVISAHVNSVVDTGFNELSDFHKRAFLLNTSMENSHFVDDAALTQNYFIQPHPKVIVFVGWPELEYKHEFTEQWIHRVEIPREFRMPEYMVHWYGPEDVKMYPVTLPFFLYLKKQFLNMIQTPVAELKSRYFGITPYTPFSYFWYMFKDFPDECDYAGDFFRLLLSGDVELNPGPVHSLPYARNYNNDPRYARYEAQITRQKQKITAILKKIRQDIKAESRGIHCQMFDSVRDWLTFPSKLNSQTDILLDFLDTQLPKIQSELESVISLTMDRIENLSNKIISITLVVSLVYWLMQNDYNRSAILVILAAAVQFFQLPQKIVGLVRQIQNAIRKQESHVTTQGIMEDVIYSPWFGLCGQIIFATLAFVGIGQIPGKKDWDNYILRLDRIPKAIAGATRISEYCSQYFNLACDHLKMLVLNKSEAELGHVKALYAEIYAWADDVVKYCNLSERGKIDESVETAQYVEQLYLRGLSYNKENITDRHILHLIKTTLHPAELLYKYVNRSPSRGAGPRMRAVNVWLNGSSGVGKSEIVYPLCIDILRAMGISVRDYHALVYPRYVETEFWDGYHNQKIVVYDDAFQLKDDKTAPNPEYHEVIRGCNTFPQHVHMAAIDDKNTFNVAEVNIYTTNEMNVKIESLTHPAAFYTRMQDYAYCVKPRPGYAKRTFDENNVVHESLDKTKLNPNEAVDLNAYHFQKLKRTGRISEPWTPDGDPIGFEQLRDVICDAWRREKKGFLAKSKWLADYAIRTQMNPDDDIREMLFSTLDDDEWYMQSNDSTAFARLTEEKKNEMKQETWNKLFEKDIQDQMNNGRSWEAIDYRYASDPIVFDRFCVYRDTMKLTKPVSKWSHFSESISRSLKNVGVRLQELTERAFNILRENKFICVLGLIGVTLTMFGVYEAFRYCQSREEEPTDDTRIVEVGNSGDMRTAKVARPIVVEVGTSGDPKTQKIQRGPRVESSRTEAARKLDELASAQGCNDQAAHSLSTELVRSNTYRMSYYKTVGDEEKRVEVGNCTFVTGYTIILPYHFLRTFYGRGLSPETLICLSQDQREDITRVPISHFYKCGDTDMELTDRCFHSKFSNGEHRDLVFVNLHPFVEPKRNLIRHFITIDDQSKLSRAYTSGAMATYHRAASGHLTRAYQWLSKIESLDRSIEISYPDSDKIPSYQQRDCYMYAAPTQVGDCGAVVGVYNSRMERKLIGMHIAGNEHSSIGYATPLTQEVIRDALDALLIQNKVNVQCCFDVPSNIDTSVEPDMPEGLFIPVGKADKRVNGSSKTSIIPSKLYGKITEPITRPAILRPITIDGVQVDPLKKALKKCGIQTAVIDPEIVKAAAQDVSRIALTRFNDSIDRKKYQRVLTYEEAIRGTLDDQFMKAVCRSTSPGYPYMLNNKGMPGKTRWMGKDEKFDFESMYAQQLKTDVDELIDDCAQGIIRNVFWVDTKKDERRENAKVDACKTRSFAAGPQHFVVAFRKYFLPFSAWLMHNRIDNEIAVGTNPFSNDWDRLAKRLSSKGPKVIAGDFGNFDGSLMDQIMWSMFWEIFYPWFVSFIDPNTEEGRRELNVCIGLWTHIVYSVHVFDDNVYMWTHSQPSGNPFTAILNCLYNMIIMRVSWIKIMDEVAPHLSSMQEFNRNVAMIAYGDDNVLNIANAVIEIFNQETISTMMTKIGHEYTDETKTGQVIKYRSLDEIHFLKRGFRFEKEFMRYIAPLKREVIYEMLNWTRINTVDPDTILMDNIDIAFREIILHGEQAYDDLREAILQHADVLPSRPSILTYHEYMHDFKILKHGLYDYGEHVKSEMAEDVHGHTCVSCGEGYTHEHPYTFAKHKQYRYQCPNETCGDYFGNGDSIAASNLTNSMLYF